MTDDDYGLFAEESLGFLRARIARAREEFRVGEFQRYDYDVDQLRFWWSNDGVPKVEARMTLVGSVSTTSNTWMWAWANKSFTGVDVTELLRVKEFGIAQDLPKLHQPCWRADEVDGWEMTAISSRLLESACAYRCPNDNGPLFLLLDDLRWV